MTTALIEYGYNRTTLPPERFVLLPMWRRVHPEMQRRVMALIVLTGQSTIGAPS